MLPLDKLGVVTRDVLTKHWTDWVDYDAPGRYTIAVKVIDIFGNDTMTLVLITVG